MHQNYFDYKQEKLNLNKKGKKKLPEEYEVGLVPIRKLESTGTSRDLEFQGESLLASQVFVQHWHIFGMVGGVGSVTPSMQGIGVGDSL